MVLLLKRQHKRKYTFQSIVHLNLFPVFFLICPLVFLNSLSFSSPPLGAFTISSKPIKTYSLILFIPRDIALFFNYFYKQV